MVKRSKYFNRKAILKSLEPTEAQLKLIETICHDLQISFEPKDKYDAQKFISDWYETWEDYRMRNGFIRYL